MLFGLKYVSIILFKYKIINKLYMGLYICKFVQSLFNIIIDVYLWGLFLVLNLFVYIVLKGFQIYLVYVYIYKIRRLKNENIGI